ncbi:MAG: hypothetical protein V4641_31410 [Pseudomonadota bacterium]
MIFRPDMAAVFMTMPSMNYSPVDLARRMTEFNRVVHPRICQIAALESLRKPAPYTASDGSVIPGYRALSKRTERAIATLHFEIESVRRMHFPE